MGSSQYLAAAEVLLTEQSEKQNVASKTDSVEEVAPTSYASIRRNVQIKTESIRHRSMQSVRPANSYQLAGASNNELCLEILAAFNEQGTYQGPDSMFWALENSKAIEWLPIDVKRSDLGGGYLERSFGLGVEYAVLDVDGDGSDEYVYRVGDIVSGRSFQSISIFDLSLQGADTLLSPYKKACEEINLAMNCGEISSQIIFATSPSVTRLKEEWVSTKSGLLDSAVGDEHSKKLIYPRSGSRAERNVGGGNSEYWNLYRVKSGLVAVLASTLNYAPPEFLVFSPYKQRRGDLQCVIMPVIWNKQ